MFYFKTLFYSIFALLGMLIAVVSCSKEYALEPIEDRYWSDIVDTGKIVFITLNQPPFFYKQFGVDCGFNLELAKKFAFSHNLEYEVIIAKSCDDMIKLLNEGKGDVIAYSMPNNIDSSHQLIFCGDSTKLHPTLVKRWGRWDRDIKSLEGDTIFINRGSLGSELFNDSSLITIIEIDFDSVNMLIDSVAMGKLDYTITDNISAAIYRQYYKNLDISFRLGERVVSAWSVKGHNSTLADSINAWFGRQPYRGSYFSLLNMEMNKYRFGSRHISVPSLSVSIRDGVISPYDSSFKHYGGEIGLDWRLLAALGYCESKFDSTVVSKAGACGVMQVMPNTANSYGVDTSMIMQSDKNIYAGAKVIANTIRTFRDIENPTSRLKFALAAYNAGAGHIYDAIAIADSLGMDGTVWEDNVETAIMLKSNPEFYNDSISKFGYLRGWETRDFVTKVMAVYKYYKQNF